MVKNINSPIEWAYHSWINHFPESFNPPDMKHFYVLIKTILRYGRKINYFDLFKLKISNSKLSKADQCTYLDLYTTVVEVCESRHIDYRQFN